MKRILLAAIIGFLMSPAAFAQSTNTNTNSNQIKSNIDIHNAATSSASMNASFGSGSGSFSPSASINEVHQAPAISGYVAASGPCTGPSFTAGVSAPMVGVFAGGSTIEGQCQEREFARIALASNNPILQQEGVQVMEHLYQELEGSSSNPKNSQTSQLPTGQQDQVAEVPALTAEPGSNIFKPASRN